MLLEVVKSYVLVSKWSDVEVVPGRVLFQLQKYNNLPALDL